MGEQSRRRNDPLRDRFFLDIAQQTSSIFQDYPDILSLIDRLSVERTGYGTYEFLDKNGETIKKVLLVNYPA